jgi:tRNA threonylcarbamoyl adenosine modification protein (Sua5/YciO/YrdC/YwlC family)
MSAGDDDAARYHGIMRFMARLVSHPDGVRDSHVRGQSPAMSWVDEVVAAIKAGEPVVLPTDTVYGLCADAYHEAPARQLARLKGRPEGMPIALLAADLDVILDAVPELRGRAAVLARALLPGPYTLVLPNPARRFRWLTGSNDHTIGIRVPALPGQTRAVLECVGAVAATSANLHGTADPARLEDVPETIARAAAALVDGGELPGAPSTVIDLTGPQPRVLREGAVPAHEALATVARVARE